MRRLADPVKGPSSLLAARLTPRLPAVLPQRRAYVTEGQRLRCNLQVLCWLSGEEQTSVALTRIDWVPGFDFDRHLIRDLPDWPGFGDSILVVDDDPAIGQYVLTARPRAPTSRPSSSRRASSARPPTTA